MTQTRGQGNMMLASGRKRGRPVNGGKNLRVADPEPTNTVKGRSRHGSRCRRIEARRAESPGAPGAGGERTREPPENGPKQHEPRRGDRHAPDDGDKCSAALLGLVLLLSLVPGVPFGHPRPNTSGPPGLPVLQQRRTAHIVTAASRQLQGAGGHTRLATENRPYSRERPRPAGGRNQWATCAGRTAGPAGQ